MEIFEYCHRINDLLLSGKESEARDELIQLLENLKHNNLECTPLVNRLIREVGLFPYLNLKTSSWEERYIHEVFKADIGKEEPVTLHREQSKLLNALLSGQDIAVSAPTSFGKSFIIDSFISIKHPSNVVIIVPTIALADETRRRLQIKFGFSYKIITTPGQSLGEKNILIFPQERALGYVDELEHIDILIVDEFYKASHYFDKERSPSLIRIIFKLRKISGQRYFLAPNIDELRDNPITKGMKFLRLDFNTVFLKKNDFLKEIGANKQKKNEILLKILEDNPEKTLIYAGTYKNIDDLSVLLGGSVGRTKRKILENFRFWLEKNYDPKWVLANLVEKGIGIHNGRLHRSISQIQIRLFEEKYGLDRLISTSSIIEGVNTSAENIILWSNKNGGRKINDLTFKNIIGRGGRMFRHFVGKIFILEKPPNEKKNQLTLGIPNELLVGTNLDSMDIDLTRNQISEIEKYKSEMSEFVGKDDFEYFRNDAKFQNSDYKLVLEIVKRISRKNDSWKNMNNLNSDNPEYWDPHLRNLIELQPGKWGIEHNKFRVFVKMLSNNTAVPLTFTAKPVDLHAGRA